MHAQQMIATHPHVQGSTNNALVAAIETAMDCAQICTSCADACLGETNVAQLTQCIRLNLDCADICSATAHVATRRTGSNEAVIVSQLEACVLACRLCAEECERHAEHHEHCRICADTCTRCERICRKAIESIRAH